MAFQAEGAAWAKAWSLERAWPVGGAVRGSLWLDHGVRWGRGVSDGARRGLEGLSTWGSNPPVWEGPPGKGQLHLSDLSSAPPLAGSVTPGSSGLLPGAISPSAQRKAILLFPKALSLAQRGPEGTVGWQGVGGVNAVLEEGQAAPSLLFTRKPLFQGPAWSSRHSQHHSKSLDQTQEREIPHGSWPGWLRFSLWRPPPTSPPTEGTLPGPGLPGFSGTADSRLWQPLAQPFLQLRAEGGRD